MGGVSGVGIDTQSAEAGSTPARLNRGSHLRQVWTSLDPAKRTIEE
ncbi:cell division cycle [Aspergillus luchuensis]|uniref:Cell division cycle n=1 Tax=Aspergillus kawachii TaxID=1069201 RepID=A0A146F9D2_ASPKA|nr:cell division cycle [Aspergillus luchuensis]